MCGIFGFIAASTAKKGHLDFTEEYLVTGQVRGEDGTGMLVVQENLRPVHGAHAVRGADFHTTRRGKKLINATAGCKAVVGHHRRSTSGKDVDEHCHPFERKNIVGVHNGVIPQSVLDKIDPSGVHPVDSARVFDALARASDPLDVLSQITMGAYALVWYNKKKKSIFMARNHERPLHVLNSSNGVMFGSEAYMLASLAGRNFLYSKDDGLACLNVHTLYEFPMEDLSKATATKYSLKYPEYPVHHSGGGHHGVNYNWNNWQNQNQSNRAIPKTRPNETVTSFDRTSHMYLTLTMAENRHPEVYREITALQKQFTFPAKALDPYVDMVITGVGKSIVGIDGVVGYVVTPEGYGICSNLPVHLKCMNKTWLEFFQNMLPKPNEADPQYPIVNVCVDKFRVTADGTLQTETTTSGPTNPLRWVTKVDPRFIEAAPKLIRCDELEMLSPSQLAMMWSQGDYYDG